MVFVDASSHAYGMVVCLQQGTQSQEYHPLSNTLYQQYQG